MNRWKQAAETLPAGVSWDEVSTPKPWPKFIAFSTKARPSSSLEEGNDERGDLLGLIERG